MNIHDILDRVFYKTDKETGERKVSCCKLIIVIIVLFMIIGILTSASSNDSNQTSNDSNDYNSSVDILEALDIEPFTEDTVVNIGSDSFTIPAGYGEDTISKDSHKQNDITIYTEHYQYMNNEGELIMIDYIYEEHRILDDTALNNVDGSFKTIGGHEGKLSQKDDNYYEFVFMKNHKEIMISAPTEKNIETILS